MADKPKPRGFGAFDALARKLVQVPKEDADSKVARDRAKRIKQRKKKK